MAKQKALDMTHGSLWNKIPLFALPVAATGILEQLFNAADIAVVGRFTGNQATRCMAAVGANSAIIGLILNLFIGITLGANVVIAHAIGEGNDDSVRRATHTAVVFAVVAGLVVTIFGEIFTPAILRATDVPKKVLPLAILYLRIYFIGMPVILLYNFEAAIFRAIGKTTMPLIALLISGILNVILNLFFVIVVHMTVNGVATATVIANVASSAFLFWRLTRETTPVRITPKQLKINGNSLKKILRIGLPSGIQAAVFAVANIVIQTAVNSLGATIMAGSSASLTLEYFCYSMLSAFGQAASTFVGQNDGAGQPKRCRRVLGLCILEDYLFTGVFAGLILLFAHQLLGIFNTDPRVIGYGYIKLRTLCIAYTMSILYEVMAGYLRGYGISLTPAILTTIGVCGVRLLWIFFYFPTHHTFAQLLYAYPLSFVVTDILIGVALLIFHPAKRRERQMTVAVRNK